MRSGEMQQWKRSRSSWRLKRDDNRDDWRLKREEKEYVTIGKNLRDVQKKIADQKRQKQKEEKKTLTAKMKEKETELSLISFEQKEEEEEMLQDEKKFVEIRHKLSKEAAAAAE
ncbi:uncharacterized protein MONOS_6430 [Monocercomonoides exilis]|uniref:uncharacterized protein n=1 Tax=Monocercomonoides exilis TaxID=2049356 RepID=UPI0035596B32|nr:hypothetical protein MONOS_6430 [Monocercomonoides exilis]|eukprot:MONOS_6430.1-p1 / transcript=MONOS_6430.1 / gene=MONOS_6430 / organism=Monocercomonoides_exilis_PA203 / gene_product=unspecified product / transcript_product=unspecified product / location=Mono_scaffold00202:49833-50174(+) / protein_length=114 / sequence_SO=supercontig / SO=protein_coding / is_pseudo=false